MNDGSNGYLLTYENARNAQQYGLQLTGSIKPFGNNVLVGKIVIAPASETLKTSEGKIIRNDYFGNYFNISSAFGNFNLQYQFNIPYYTLNGAFLSTNENASHFFANYRKANWTFTTGIYWLGMPSEYKTKSLPESLVNYSAKTQIFNNKNMFVLGLSYDFATGKKTDIQKKLNNSTAPASTF